METLAVCCWTFSLCCDFLHKRFFSTELLQHLVRVDVKNGTRAPALRCKEGETIHILHNLSPNRTHVEQSNVTLTRNFPIKNHTLAESKLNFPHILVKAVLVNVKNPTKSFQELCL